ncbi:MAG TPA: cation diffusion facilitator family transporter [Solirubrobacteraceae bacterium]|nr:cation diffusion facilitator family transporter [Solirubrobacteraceae bacterium]
MDSDAHAPHAGPDRSAETRRLAVGLGLLCAFMGVEVVAGLLAHSLALLSDAAHMLTDAVALAVSLFAARLVMRPAGGAMTYGLGRAEILSAQANALTMLVLAGLILYGAVIHLIHPGNVQGAPVLIVALLGVVVNLVIVRVLGGHGHGHGHGHGGHGHDHGAHDHGAHDHDAHDHDERPRRSLNIEGSVAHIATDLFGFIATAIAAAIILLSGFHRADAIASLLIALVMVAAGWPLLCRSLRVVMEAAPAGIDPDEIGRTLAAQPGVAEVHDLHVWEVTTGFPTLSAHIVVDAGHDCHEVRRGLTRLLEARFGIPHSTLQVEHARAPQPPMQIEVMPHA